MRKLAYLGIGDCSKTEAAEKTIIKNSSYINSGASKIYLDMKSKLPVCELKM